MPNVANEPKVEEKKVETIVEKDAPKEIPKKTKKPREKVRSTEECLELPVSKLTDKEKENLIKTLKEAVTVTTNKSEAYKANAEAAFEQTRETEKRYDAMEQYYRRLLAYVDAQTNAFHSAINQAIKGGAQ